MRFLLDANIPRSATDLMRAKGQNVIHVSDTALKDTADEEIAQYALSEQRIVVTRDLDISDVRRYPPENAFGYLVIKIIEPGTFFLLEPSRMQIAINLPNDFVQMQTVAVIEREMRTSYALALFKAARVTLSKAAELADMTLYEFIKSCKDHQIPVIDISKEELMEELESMRPACS